MAIGLHYPESHTSKLIYNLCLEIGFTENMLSIRWGNEVMIDLDSRNRISIICGKNYYERIYINITSLHFPFPESSDTNGTTVRISSETILEVFLDAPDSLEKISDRLSLYL